MSEKQEFDLWPTGSSAPPPLPLRTQTVSPLAYAMPGPALGPRQKTFFHQAARASWIAPLIALGLGMSTLNTRDQFGAGTSLIIGIVNLSLIAGGFILAIVAFCGVRKHGSAGILVDAIVGALLNGILLALFGSLFFFASALNRPRRAGPAAAPAFVPFTSPQSSLRQTGWLGVGQSNGVSIVLVVADDSHADIATLKQEMKQDCSIVAMAIDNTAGLAPVNIDTVGATLRFDEGQSVQAINVKDVLDPKREPTLFGRLTPPIRIAAGELSENRFLFIPPNLNMERLKSVTLKVDGMPLVVPGRIFSDDEKTRAYEQGRTQRPR